MKTVEEINLKELIEVETLEQFNRAGKIRSPFNSNDKTPSCSVYFNSNLNKWKYKDFSTGAEGDCLDFIMHYKGYDYNQAREYLGIEVEKTPAELEIDKVKNFVEWQINHQNNSPYKGMKIIGIFQFVDRNNNPLYYKVKLVDENGKKITPYYHVEGDKVINKRGADEVPYNYFNLCNAIASNKPIIVLEGEKDVNTINNTLRSKGFVATSFKGCKDLSFFEGSNPNLILIGDTGLAGEKYITDLKFKLLPIAKSLRIVTLQGLKQLGDNMDVTDWLEAGHDREDLLNAIDRSLDLKNMNELQQSKKGIYKTTFKKTEEGVDEKYRYITNFNVIEASRIELVDEEKEGVKLILKSSTGHLYERVGRSTIFNDLRTFKNFLGTMDLVFLGKGDDLGEFTDWVNKYFALDVEKIYSGVKILPIEDKLHLVTPEGAVTPTGVDRFIKSDKTNKLSIVDVDPINADELREVLKYLFEFTGPDKVYTIIGTVINNLMVSQCESLGINLHHLLLVGESGCGKSTTLKNVILPLLNLPTDSIKSIGMTSAFAMEKDLSSGNYTSLYDEFKPSMMDSRKCTKISDVLRNLYERNVNYKGDKSLNSREYRLSRPIVICGEESYPNAEKANIERSAIVYMAVSDQNDKTKEAIDWLIENENLLRKLGRSLINKCLNLTNSDYLSIREQVKGNIPWLKKRPLNTAINACSGISILNMVMEDLGLYDLKIQGFEECIALNVKQEVLEDGEETKNIIEQMLLLFDNMIADGRVRNIKTIIQFKGTELYIRTSEMIDSIHEYCNRIGSAELIPLKARDFKKQCTKAGYILKDQKKKVRFFNDYTNISTTAWFDRFSVNKIRDLGCMNIAPLSEFEEKVQASRNIPPIEENQASLPF